MIKKYNKKKIYFCIIILITILLFVFFYLYINKTINTGYKSPLLLRLNYIFSEETKKIIKETIFIFNYKEELKSQINILDKRNKKLQLDFENFQRNAEIKEILFKKNYDDKLKTKYNNYEFKKFQTNFLITSKNENAQSTAYLEYYNNRLFLVSASGIFSYVNIDEFKKDNIAMQTIKTNIKNFINYEDFYYDSKYGIKDVLIYDNKIFVSYSNQLTTDCYNISLVYADLNVENLIFKKFFNPDECVNKINEYKEFNPHHSGGRIVAYKNNEILLSIGEYSFSSLAQKNSSVFGKIVSINIDSKQYRIISMGHKNAQGLFYDKKNDAIYSTDHGPQGGDEVNVQIQPDKKIVNFGWPISSYGEHYNFLKRDDNHPQYKKAPFYKSHKKYGFEEPVKVYTPGIGISEIIQFNTNDNNTELFIASMGDTVHNGKMAIHNLILNNKFEILKEEIIALNERIRDMIYIKNLNSLFIYLETSSSIGIVKLK